MRRAGLFVAVALTRPFDFEGRRKSEEASALVEALQDVANLVVVVPQAVLTRASAELTITDALEISDVTLETSCRAILWALGVPEVLLASSGGWGAVRGAGTGWHPELRVRGSLPEVVEQAGSRGAGVCDARPL
jgi:cell division protein FtsZ